jgi:hypothetical protein
MKILVDNDVLFEINDTEKKILADTLFMEELEAELRQKIQWIIAQELTRSFKKLKDDWEPKLAAAGVTMIPTDKLAFAELVFSQPEYKSRSEREKYVPRPL